MVIAGVLALWWGFGGQSPSPSGGGFGFGGEQGQGAVVVEAGEVRRMDVTDVKQYTASLQANHQFTLAPKTGGRVRELLVDIGDTVEHGQVIARLDDEEFIQQAEEARAALEVARAQLGDAQAQAQVREREFERLQEVRRQGLVSESEFDLARSEFEAAQANIRVNEAQVMQRQAALSAAQIRSSYTTVRAEWSDSDGQGTRVVGERFVDEGTNVAANEALISVLDNSSMRAVAFVTDRDYARLRVGQPAEVISDALPGEVFPGRIARIAPQLQEDTRQVRIEVDVPNEHGRLSPGFFVTLNIEIETVEDAVVVPADSLSRHAGQTGVYLIDGENGIARFQPVTAGVRTPDYVQIIDPEISGHVVTLGQHRLGHETPVRLADAGSEG